MTNPFLNPIAWPVLLALWAIGAMTVFLGLAVASIGHRSRMALPFSSGACLGSVVRGIGGVHFDDMEFVERIRRGDYAP